MRKSPRSSKVTRALLDRSPLPAPDEHGDKETRGTVLVIGGEVALPGAVVLAGIAALRAGAGKLQLASCKSTAAHIGVTVPEALSLGLRETASGRIDPADVRSLRQLVAESNAILIGPGMTMARSNLQLTVKLLRLPTDAAIVLDAGALAALTDSPGALHNHDGNALITPHRAEMATILGVTEKAVEANAAVTALEVATSLHAIVALKGSTTFIATPDGELFRYESGDVGLATSGSGDTLAGIAAGLLARGANPRDAALWAVYLHGEAGNRLARRVGRIGYLARELLAEIPPLLRS